MKLPIQTIFPVIVLFRTQLHDCPSYLTLLKNSEVGQFMVYDNSPADYPVDINHLDSRAIYHRDTNNSGLSKAYNTAARYAAEKGYERILILDQDTTFPQNALDVYLQGDPSIPIWAPIMISGEGTPFSPVRIDGFNLKVPPAHPGQYSLYQLNPVNSGMCIQIESFWKANGYNEKVKLDYADFEFCKRLRQHCPSFQLLPLVAHQDFSNDNPDASALIFRHRLYLESAIHCQHTSFIEKLRHHYQVSKHTLALFLKTRSFKIVHQYLQLYLFL